MSAKTTKRVRVREIAPEYRFDYTKSRPNRFAKRLKAGALVVVIDPDVAKVFKDAKQVNAFLRATIAAVEKPRSKRAG